MMTLLQVKKFIFFKVPNVLIVLGLVFLSISFGPILRDEAWYYFTRMKNQSYILETSSASGPSDGSSPFARFLTSRPVKLTPVNTEFSLVIEKLGVSAPIVRDVPVWDSDEYSEALKSGIAHASSSPYPSDKPGNVYLFAHASVNFWELGQYATVFNLLRKLEPKDRVHLFYDNAIYVYEVVTTETVKGWDVRPLTRPVVEPILTLQTCDPPGTTINRLVVTAKLIKVDGLPNTQGI